jgi:hypothetical protein
MCVSARVQMSRDVPINFLKPVNPATLVLVVRIIRHARRRSVIVTRWISKTAT